MIILPHVAIYQTFRVYGGMCSCRLGIGGATWLVLAYELGAEVTWVTLFPDLRTSRVLSSLTSINSNIAPVPALSGWNLKLKKT